ncbi:MAG: RrF2 family transcriptional regulator [Eubacteriales bacterium]
MLISSKGRYALRVMLELARYPAGEYVPLAGIAEEQEISEKYLESILVALSKAGYVDGLRGKGGGYRLNRAPEEYTVGGILRIVEGSIAPVACLEEDSDRKCGRATCCKTLPVWEKLGRLIDDYLDSVTLADVEKEDGEGCGTL